jgi:hypothetical protein
VAGKVTDSTGAIVPSTVVTIKNEATGVSQTVLTNSAGDFAFQLLNPGTYVLSLDSPGFKHMERTHVVVDVGQTNAQDVALTTGGSSETITVSAGGAQQLSTTSATTGLIFEERSIRVESPRLRAAEYGLDK